MPARFDPPIYDTSRLPPLDVLDALHRRLMDAERRDAGRPLDHEVAWYLGLNWPGGASTFRDEVRRRGLRTVIGADDVDCPAFTTDPKVAGCLKPGGVLPQHQRVCDGWIMNWHLPNPHLAGGFLPGWQSCGASEALGLCAIAFQYAESAVRRAVHDPVGSYATADDLDDSPEDDGTPQP